MNFYDRIHEFVRAFKETEEYKQFFNLKNKLKEEPSKYNMIKDFKEKQKQNQIKVINGEQISDQAKNEMQNLYSILIQDEDIRKLLEYEMKLDVYLADMQKIMGEAVKDIIDF